MMNFSLPTTIHLGKNCILQNSKAFCSCGKKALIVTGRSSAKLNGAQRDVEEALKRENITYALYDQITSNPSIDQVREAAIFARRENTDFVIGIGGGSPIDAAKAIAILATNNLTDMELFLGPYVEKFLTVVAIPTTAGTGSEVTPFSVLNDSKTQSKKSIANSEIFPKLAFLDAKYTLKLPLSITVNTAIDALSHALEGYLSVKATPLSNLFAEKSLAVLGACLPQLLKENTIIVREQLLYASMLAGVVIAHTGTTAVHAMGYSLTYFKNIDHGRANGLLLVEYLKLIHTKHLGEIVNVLSLLQLKSLDEFSVLMDALLGERDKITAAEAVFFSKKALTASNINNSLIDLAEKDVLAILKKSLFVIE